MDLLGLEIGGAVQHYQMLPPKRLVARQHTCALQCLKHLPIHRLQILGLTGSADYGASYHWEGLHAKELLGITPSFGHLHRPLMGQKRSLLRKEPCKGPFGRLRHRVFGPPARIGQGLKNSFQGFQQPGQAEQFIQIAPKLTLPGGAGIGCVCGPFPI
jgi:hypothetical protein